MMGGELAQHIVHIEVTILHPQKTITTKESQKADQLLEGDYIQEVGLEKKDIIVEVARDLAVTLSTV